MLAGNAVFEPWAPSGAYDSIATTTLGSTTATITFSSIPATYTHLQIRLIGRCNRAVEASDAVLMRFNSDTASNYSYHGLYGDGSSAGTYGAASTTFATIMDCTAAGAAASIFGVGVCDILDYANTNKYKTVKSLQGFDRNGAGTLQLVSSNWRNTNAITSIDLTPANGSWIQYTSAALYGIKGA
jgi:hypothetical protein